MAPVVRCDTCQMGAETRSQRSMVAVGLFVGVGLAVTGWSAIGPDHVVYALVVQGGFFFMALLVGPVLTGVARSRYRVAAFEPRLYTLLGAELVRRALGFIGWNRLVRQMRQPKDRSLDRRRLVSGTERSETGHLVGASATVLLAIVALAAAHPQGAWQILLVGLLMHWYPIMIQRIVRYRILGYRTEQHPAADNGAR